MKSKIILLTALCLLLGVSAHAQESRGKMIGLGMNPQMADYIARKLIHVNTSGDTELRIGAGKKVVMVEGNGTPVGYINDGISQAVPLIFTPTTSLTPVAVLGPLNLLATASPTLASGFLPTPSVDGQKVRVFNGGASPFVVMAAGTPVVNLGASRRVNLATRTQLDCTYSSIFVSWICDLLAAGPTPAA